MQAKRATYSSHCAASQKQRASMITRVYIFIYKGGQTCVFIHKIRAGHPIATRSAPATTAESITQPLVRWQTLITRMATPSLVKVCRRAFSLALPPRLPTQPPCDNLANTSHTFDPTHCAPSQMCSHHRVVSCSGSSGVLLQHAQPPARKHQSPRDGAASTSCCRRGGSAPPPPCWYAVRMDKGGVLRAAGGCPHYGRGALLGWWPTVYFFMAEMLVTQSPLVLMCVQSNRICIVNVKLWTRKYLMRQDVGHTVDVEHCWGGGLQCVFVAEMFATPLISMCARATVFINVVNVT